MTLKPLDTFINFVGDVLFYALAAFALAMVGVAVYIIFF